MVISVVADVSDVVVGDSVTDGSVGVPKGCHWVTQLCKVFFNAAKYILVEALTQIIAFLQQQNVFEKNDVSLLSLLVSTNDVCCVRRRDQRPSHFDGVSFRNLRLSCDV